MGHKSIDNDERITNYPLYRRVIEKSNHWSAIGEMHDRQIAAMAMVAAEDGQPVDLLTVDANITASKMVLVVR